MILFDLAQKVVCFLFMGQSFPAPGVKATIYMALCLYDIKSVHLLSLAYCT